MKKQINTRDYETDEFFSLSTKIKALAFCLKLVTPTSGVVIFSENKMSMMVGEKVTLSDALQIPYIKHIKNNNIYDIYAISDAFKDAEVEDLKVQNNAHYSALRDLRDFGVYSFSVDFVQARNESKENHHNQNLGAKYLLDKPKVSTEAIKIASEITNQVIDSYKQPIQAEKPTLEPQQDSNVIPLSQSEQEILRRVEANKQAYERNNKNDMPKRAGEF